MLPSRRVIPYDSWNRPPLSRPPLPQIFDLTSFGLQIFDLISGQFQGKALFGVKPLQSFGLTTEEYPQSFGLNQGQDSPVLRTELECTILKEYIKTSSCHRTQWERKTSYPTPPYQPHIHTYNRHKHHRYSAVYGLPRKKDSLSQCLAVQRLYYLSSYSKYD